MYMSVCVPSPRSARQGCPHIIYIYIHSSYEYTLAIVPLRPDTHSPTVHKKNIHPHKYELATVRLWSRQKHTLSQPAYIEIDQVTASIKLSIGMAPTYWKWHRLIIKINPENISIMFYQSSYAILSICGRPKRCKPGRVWAAQEKNSLFRPKNWCPHPFYGQGRAKFLDWAWAFCSF